MPHALPPAALSTFAEADPTCEGVLTAAILDLGGTNVHQLLRQAGTRLQQAGRRVHGLVMESPAGDHHCASEMVLVDLRTAETYLVSQALGAGSNACRADPQGFARASAVLREALQAQAELVISNRFGGLEAEGGGFAAELLALMAAGVPVLTAVAPRHLAAWQAFTGGAPTLGADEASIDAWLSQALPSDSPSVTAHAPQ